MNYVLLKLIIFSVLVMVLQINTTSAALTQKQIERTGKVMVNACKASSGVQRSLVLRATQGDLVEDRKLKCFFGCVFETLQVIKNGKLNPESLRKRATSMLPTEMREAILPTIEYCGSLENEDKCDLAFSLVECHFSLSGKNVNALNHSEDIMPR